MYTESQPVIFSELTESGYVGAYTQMSTNGYYVRGRQGKLFEKAGNTAYLRLIRVAAPDSIVATITDKLLCDRIVEYFQVHYPSRITNCSAFANFLFTGEFAECQIEDRLLVAKHYMRDYTETQKVSVGDIVCLMYGNHKVLKSRKLEYRKSYRKQGKERCEKGASFSRSVCKPKNGVLSPDELHELHLSALIDDFHFMVCVAKHNGLPVWLSQLGRKMKDDGHIHLALTIGNEEPYGEFPLVSLIKRRT